MRFIFHFVPKPLQIVGLCCFLYWPCTMHVTITFIISFWFFICSSEILSQCLDSATWNKAHFAFDSMLMYHLLSYLWPFYSPLHSLYLFGVSFLLFRFPCFRMFLHSTMEICVHRVLCKWNEWMFAAILISIRFEYEKRKSEHLTLSIACI